MSKSEKPSFSDNALLVAETFQYYLGRTKRGAKLVEKKTGGNPDYYEQLLWIPRFKFMNVDIREHVRVPGDPEAEGPAANWPKAALITVPVGAASHEGEAFPLEDQAVAYRSSKVWHVGISAVHSRLLSSLPDNAGFGEGVSGVVVRRGRGDTDFSLGQVGKIERVFRAYQMYGLKAPVEAHLIDASDVPEISPDLKLV